MSASSMTSAVSIDSTSILSKSKAFRMKANAPSQFLT